MDRADRQIAAGVGGVQYALDKRIEIDSCLFLSCSMIFIPTHVVKYLFLRVSNMH